MNEITIYPVSSTQEMAKIKAIRQKVFQEEQGVSPELEFDDQDQTAVHLLANLNGEAVGTARFRFLDAQKAKIERLAVLSSVRGQGIGTKIMIKAIEMIGDRGPQEVIVHAQAYIQELYLKLGFEAIGSPFMEAGIPHLKMIKKLENHPEHP